MLKITVEKDGKSEIIDLSAEQQKAFEFVANGPTEFVFNMITNNERRALDAFIVENTDRQPKKMIPVDKRSLAQGISGVELKQVKVTVDHDGEVKDITIDSIRAAVLVEEIKEAIPVRVGAAVDQIVKETSDKQPEKIDMTEKLTIVKNAIIKSAKQRHEAMLAEIEI